jgi:hypothetical protein
VTRRRRAVAQSCFRGRHRDQFVDERRSRSAGRRRGVSRYFGIAQPGVRGEMSDGKNRLPTRRVPPRSNNFSTS